MMRLPRKSSQNKLNNIIFEEVYNNTAKVPDY